MNKKGIRNRWQPDKDWLKHKYVDMKMTLSEIGEESGVSGATVMRALMAVNIDRRGPKDMINKRGPNHGNWKIGKVSYSAYHKRIYKINGKAKHCEECGRTDTDTVYNWANLTGKFGDPNDYASLCRSCHMRLDDPNKNRRKDKSKRSTPRILIIRGINTEG